jgi:hypothetical protein
LYLDTIGCYTPAHIREETLLAFLPFFSLNIDKSQGDRMKKQHVLPLIIGIWIISACAPQATATPVLVEATVPPMSTVPPTEIPQSPAWTEYANEAFGLRFAYPANWFGPDEYISEPILRVQVGSDVVYPYGTDRTEQNYTVPNAYYLTIQYSKTDQSAVWFET